MLELADVVLECARDEEGEFMTTDMVACLY